VNLLIRPGENGMLVDPAEDRTEALARGLTSLIASEGLRDRLGAAGPASVEAYAPDRIYDCWDELLRSIRGRGSGAG
jgi:glycosyltransferase involved in cell wall biosynthesis